MKPTDSKLIGRRLAPVLGILTMVSALSVAALPAQEGAAGGESTLKVTLERLGSFFYAGDPILVRVSVFNTGDSPYQNASGLDLIGSTEVINLDLGQRLESRADRKPRPGSEPQVLLPGGFFGYVADLNETVAGATVPGKFRARVSLPGADPAEVDLVIIERYDPSSAYRAVLDTNYGKISFDLLGGKAPKHVQNFYDLANQGYYDGTLVHVIIKGIEIRAGERTGDRRSSPGYSLEPEIDPDLKHRRGTLSMLRTGPRDHGSQFIISLGDNRRVDGLLSIFGTLAKGDDTLAALEGLPTSGTREAAPYRPLTQVAIRSIRVEAAPDGSAATGEVTASEASR